MSRIDLRRLKLLRCKVRRQLRGEQDLDELCRLGLKIGPGVFVGEAVVIDRDFAWLVPIGEHTVLSRDVMEQRRQRREGACIVTG